MLTHILLLFTLAIHQIVSLRVASRSHLKKRAIKKQSASHPGPGDTWRRGYAAPRGAVLTWIFGEGFFDVPVFFQDLENLANTLRSKIQTNLASKQSERQDWVDLEDDEELQQCDADIAQYEAVLNLKEPRLDNFLGFQEALLRGLLVQKPIAEAMSQVSGWEVPRLFFRSPDQAYQVCGVYALGADYVWYEINEGNWKRYAPLFTSSADRPGITPLAILKRTGVDLDHDCVRPPQVAGTRLVERFAGVQHITPTKNLRTDGGILVRDRPNFLVDGQNLAVDDPGRYATPPRPGQKGYRPYTFGHGVYFWPPGKDLSGYFIHNRSGEPRSLLSCVIQGVTWRVFKPNFPGYSDGTASLIEGGALELVTRRGKYLKFINNERNEEFTNLLTELVRAHDIRAWINLKSPSQWNWQVDEGATEPFLFVVRPSAIESCVEVEVPKPGAVGAVLASGPKKQIAACPLKGC